MAEAPDRDSRTHEPTPRRREEARQHDQVPQSRDVNTAAVIMAALAVGAWAVPALIEQQRRTIGLWLDMIATTDVSVQTIGPILRRALDEMVVFAWPVMATVAVAGGAAQVAQVGFRFRPQRLQPKLGSLNPMQGLRKMLSPDGLVTVGKAALKLGFVGYIAYRVVLHTGTGAEGLVALHLPAILSFIGNGVFQTIAWVGGALALIAAADFAYEYSRVEKNLKMTRQQVEDEQRASEGDVKVKRRFRKYHYELTKNRMLAEVPGADVVVTNPVHVAVAIRYVADTMRAPQVIAKGAGEVAAQIKNAARSAGVPIIERRALARALFRTVKVGQEIPAGLYRAVAEILAYIYSLRRASAAAAAGARVR
jgi:flagellar biosynthetic protein FlhB